MDNLIEDILTKLREIGSFNWVAPWNNQLEKLENAEGYAIHNPSAYVEMETLNFGQLGSAYQGLDMLLSIHIVSEELDAGDGNIDAFLSVFGLRDLVIKKLSLYECYQGGFMVKENEYQDYEHTNLYHYIIQYRFHYIDDTAAVEPITVTGSTLQISGITITRN